MASLVVTCNLRKVLSQCSLRTVLPAAAGTLRVCRSTTSFRAAHASSWHLDSGHSTCHYSTARLCATPSLCHTAMHARGSNHCSGSSSSSSSCKLVSGVAALHTAVPVDDVPHAEMRRVCSVEGALSSASPEPATMIARLSPNAKVLYNAIEGELAAANGDGNDKPTLQLDGSPFDEDAIVNVATFYAHIGQANKAFMVIQWMYEEADKVSRWCSSNMQQQQHAQRPSPSSLAHTRWRAYPCGAGNHFMPRRLGACGHAASVRQHKVSKPCRCPRCSWSPASYPGTTHCCERRVSSITYTHSQCFCSLAGDGQPRDAACSPSSCCCLV